MKAWEWGVLFLVLLVVYILLRPRRNATEPIQITDKAPSKEIPMQETPNLEQTLSLWWSFLWRTVLVSAIAGAVLGAVGGFIVGATGNPQLGTSVGALLGFLGSIPASIWGLKSAMSKRHVGYRITFVRDA